MPQVIEVPGQGMVEFPDGMTDDQIVQAIQGLSGGGSSPAPDPLAPDSPLSRAFISEMSVVPTGSSGIGARRRQEVGLNPGFIAVKEPHEVWGENVQKVLPTPADMDALRNDPLSRIVLGPALSSLPGKVSAPLLSGVMEAGFGLASPENLPWLVGPGTIGRVLLPAFAASTLPHAAADVGTGAGRLSTGDIGGLHELSRGGLTGVAMGLPLVQQARGLSLRGPEVPPAPVRVEGLPSSLPAWLDPQVLEAQALRDAPLPVAIPPEGPLRIQQTPEQMKFGLQKPRPAQGPALPPVIERPQEVVPGPRLQMAQREGPVAPPRPENPNAPTPVAFAETPAQTGQPIPFPFTPEALAPDRQGPLPFDSARGPLGLAPEQHAALPVTGLRLTPEPSPGLAGGQAPNAPRSITFAQQPTAPVEAALPATGKGNEFPLNNPAPAVGNTARPAVGLERMTDDQFNKVRHDMSGFGGVLLQWSGLVDTGKATPGRMAEFRERLKAIGNEVMRSGDVAAFDANMARLRQEALADFRLNKKQGPQPPPEGGQPVTPVKPLPSGPAPEGAVVYPLSRGQDGLVDKLGRPVDPKTHKLLPPQVQQQGPLRLAQEVDKTAPPIIAEQFVRDLGIDTAKEHTVQDVLERVSTSERVSAPERGLARFLTEHFPHVLRLARARYGVNPAAKEAGAHYAATPHEVWFTPKSQRSGLQSVLHEAAHAATLWQYENPKTGTQRAARMELDAVLNAVLQALPENERRFVAAIRNASTDPSVQSRIYEMLDEHGIRDDRLADLYAATDVHEFIASVFDNPGMRERLNAMPRVGGKSMWQRVVDAIKDLLGVRGDSALEQVFDNLWTVGEERGDIRSNRAGFDVPELVGQPPAERPLRMVEDQREPPVIPGPTATPPRIDLAPFVDDASKALPDLRPRGEANSLSAIKWASERMPVLGRALGGRARVETPQDAAIATWFHEKHGIGPAIASAFGATLSGKVDKVFGAAGKTGDLRVVPRVEGMSLKTSDVFEMLQRDPEAYQLSPSQRAAYEQRVKPVLNRARELVQKYDLVNVLDEDGNPLGYFPRVVTKRAKDAGEPNVSGRAQRFGAKQSFQRTRRYDTERQGWERGEQYETSVEKLLTTYVERLYRAIADKRLMEDPALGPTSRARREADVRAYYAEEVASGRMSEARLDGIVQSVVQEGSVNSPAFFGRVFDKETADILNREFQSEYSRISKGVAWANSLAKRIKLGFDLGAAQIQGLPTLYRRPDIWGKANAQSLYSMANPRFFPRYVEANKAIVREMAQHGSAVGHLQEYVGGLAGRDPLAKVPVVAQVSGAFGRQFQSFLDIAKVEMYKAWRTPDMPVAEQQALVRTIESILLSGRMESAMVTHRRSTLERAALLAPAYYRGAVDFVAALGERGVSGSQTRKAMGAFVVGSIATYVAIAKQAGMEDDEIMKRMDPRRFDFMMWDFEEDGKKVSVGFGGIFRSFVRLFGKVAATSSEHPERWDSLASDKNPFSSWLRGHAGPLPGAAWTMFSGKDFLGRPAKMTDTMVEAVTPLAIGDEGGGTSRAASFVGLSTVPAKRETAAEAAGDRLGNMAVWERMGLARKVEKGTPQRTGEQRMLAEQRAAEYTKERMDRLVKTLPKEQQQWLRDNRLELSPYSSSIERGGTRIPLTREEQDRLVALNEKWYRVFVGRAMERQDLDGAEPFRRQIILNRLLATARDAARDELLMSLPKARHE